MQQPLSSTTTPNAPGAVKAAGLYIHGIPSQLEESAYTCLAMLVGYHKPTLNA